MPKCKVCHSCLDVYTTEEVAVHYCFLCNKLYDIRSGKELDLFSTAYLIIFCGKKFLIAGGMFKDIDEVGDYLLDSLPESEFEIEEIVIHLSEKSLLKKIVEALE